MYSKPVLTNALELRMVFENAGHLEERNEGLVGSFDQEELERVSVEGDALKGGDNRVHDSAASD